MDVLDSLNQIEKNLTHKASLNHIPLSGAFELLPLCNMDCHMCYIRLTQTEVNKNGGIKSCDEWLSIAEQMKKKGTLFILLTGGEPLLYSQFKEVYTGLRKMGIIVTINTNGTLIDEDMADFLAKDKPRRVNVTLYGASNKTYERLCNNKKGYDETIKGIKLLKERNIDVKINLTIVEENMNDVPRMLEIADELEVPVSPNTYMYPRTRDGKNPFKYESRISPKQVAEIDYYIEHNTQDKETLKKQRAQHIYAYEYEKNNQPPDFIPMLCRAGKSSFWIDWQGNMNPCVFLDNISIDVFKYGFEKSWNYIVEESKKIYLPSSCSTCDNRGVCQVCAASVYCETESFKKRPSYLCSLTEEKIRMLKMDMGD